MQISNHLSKVSTTNIPTEVKQGEIYTAQVKERISDKEAILQIRGKEVLVQFEDKVPTSDRATIQISGQQDQKLVVKSLQNEQPMKVFDQRQTFQKLGITDRDTAELKDAVKLLLSKDQPVSKEAVQELRTFFEKAEGTLETKANTVKALVNKGLEVTQTHLRAIHEALHGKPLNEVLKNIAKELNLDLSQKTTDVRITVQSPITEKMEASTQQSAQPTYVVPTKEQSHFIRSLRTTIETEPHLSKALQTVKEQLTQNPKVDQAIVQQVDKVLQDANKLYAIGKERIVQALKNAEVQLMKWEQASVKTNEPVRTVSTVQAPRDVQSIVQNLRQEVITQPHLQQSIEKVRTELSDSNKLSPIITEKIEKALQEVTQLLRQGRITTGREVLSAALAEVENDVKSSQNIETKALEQIRQVREKIESNPNFQKAVNAVREQIINNPNIDRAVAEKVEQAVKEAIHHQQRNEEIIGKARLIQALSQVEGELEQIEASRNANSNRQLEGTSVGNQSQPVTEIKSKQPAVINNQTPSQAVRSEMAELKETMKQVREQLQTTGDWKKIVPNLQEQLNQNKHIHQETVREIERAISQANQLDQAGKERVVKLLQFIENHLKQQPTTNAEVIQNQSAQEKNIQTQSTWTQVQPTQPWQQLPNQSLQTQVQAAQNIQTQRIQKGQTQIDTQPSQQEKVDQSQQNITQKQIQQAIQSQAQQTKEQLLNTIHQQTDEQETKPVQQQVQLPSETVRQVLKLFQSEANIEEAINLVRKEISGNPNINFTYINKIEKALTEAQQYSEKGRELKARQHVATELNELQETLAKTEPKMSTIQPTQKDDVNEWLQSLNIQAKDILVTKVTQKLARITHDFRELKKEITRNLDSVHRLVQTYKSASYPQAKQLLETAISKLDNTILKSDMMLFSDMKTEKQLLQASTQLHDAKKLLSKGQFSEAVKIVNNVKQMMEKLNFKPSEQKIVHFVHKENMNLQDRPTVLETAARGFQLQEPSPRQMFEIVRSMGLNYDSELANSLVFKNDGQNQQEQQQNMKAILMKLQQEEASTRLNQQAEQAVNNLTGQQLLSKADSQNSMQTMFFTLPLLLGEKTENLQVYVNSKNNGQQVDWENCSLYFLIETKKLGDVGIMLSSTERNLSITIKNDKGDFKEKMEPLAALAIQNLKEIGYNVSSISFTRMTPVTNAHTQQEKQTEEQSKKPIFTEKGLDFRI